MNWTVKISDFAEKQLKKIDRSMQVCILNYLHERLEGCKNPRHFGEALKGNQSGLWRYRVGNYRILCEIQEETLVVLAFAIGHRSEIYKNTK